jgi:dTDP-4-amino-4,6-dideoxygalactose transaminase
MNYSSQDLPVATRAAGRIVSLPMFPQLRAEQQARVADEIYAFTSKATGSREGTEKVVVS